MAQQAVHILADGTIQQCRRFRKRIRGCEMSPHWETAEAAEIYLDNKAYLAERAAKVSEFNEAERSFSHPRRFNAIFSTDPHSKFTVRDFSERMDAYVANRGGLPLYLHGEMRFRPSVGQWAYQVDVKVGTVLEEESLQTGRRWKADFKILRNLSDYNVVSEVDLDFSSPVATRESHDQLRKLFTNALEMSTTLTGWEPPGPRFATEVEELMSRFRDMRNAVETVMQRNILEVRNDGLGDFTDSDYEGTKIVVDVEYDRSTFSPQRFRDYFRNNLYFNNPKTVDVEVRVTHRKKLGGDEVYWSLCRKEGVWSVVSASREAVYNDLTPTSEDVRSHVYWHMIREVLPDNQEQAFAKSTFAADLFTAVEDELALFNAGAPQPR